ncbi:MAG: glycosyl hydrolase, partial [Actinomycetota bacterium]
MLLAGTSRGVFRIEADGADAGSTCVLESRGVRDLIRLGHHVFAGTGAGLYRSSDDGATWELVGMADREVWQTRAGGGALYAGTQPAGLFRSDDEGATWSEVTSFAALPEAAQWCIPLDPPVPGRARALVVDPDDADRLWVGVEVNAPLRRLGQGGERRDLGPGGTLVVG